MAKTRLVSLGARLEARGRTIVAGVALADTDTGATLKLERAYTPGEGEEAGFAASVPRRQIASGLTLATVGQGQILTSVAKRRADGLLALGQGARGRTALLPRGAIVRLPAPLAATAVAEVVRRLSERPLAMLRPRDRLGAMHVFDVEEVLGQAWSPGSQVWQAAVKPPDEGSTLHLSRSYDRAAPAALDTLAAALDGRYGAVRQVAGPVRIDGGALVCDPWSVAADRLVVPDLAPAGPAAPVPPTPVAPELDPVEATRALLAGALHAGARAFAGTARTSGVVARLEATGHVATAARLSAWLGARDELAARFAHAALWVAAMIEDVEPPT